MFARVNQLNLGKMLFVAPASAPIPAMKLAIPAGTDQESSSGLERRASKSKPLRPVAVGALGRPAAIQEQGTKLIAFVHKKAFGEESGQNWSEETVV